MRDITHHLQRGDQSVLGLKLLLAGGLRQHTLELPALHKLLKRVVVVLHNTSSMLQPGQCRGRPRIPP